MITWSNVRLLMLNWNRLVTAGIVTAGVLLKVGVPLLAVALGLASVALVNWWLRAGVRPVGGSSK
jgi:hypothetical protein